MNFAKSVEKDRSMKYIIVIGPCREEFEYVDVYICIEHDCYIRQVYSIYATEKGINEKTDRK